jgi:hypothetical protein
VADSEKTSIPAELVRNGLRPDVARMLRDGYGSLRVVRRVLMMALDDLGDASANLGTVELADVRAELDRMHDELDAMDPVFRRHVDRLALLSSIEVKR